MPKDSLLSIDIVKEDEALRTYWRERDAQIDEDRDKISLKKPVQRLGEIKWVSNEPKIFYDTSVALLSSYTPRFRMPLSINYDDEEKQKMNKAERLLIGILRHLDARQFARGQSYWLRELAYWVLSGWYSVFNVVRSNNGQVEFIADLWDPRTVYPEWDADGLVKCIRSHEVDWKTVEAMLYNWQTQGNKVGIKRPSYDTNIRVINYWRRDGKKVSNAILIAGQEVKKLKVHPEFDHIPVHVGAIGVPERGSTGWKKRFGESIIAANRDMYDYENMLISLIVTIMAETAYPNIVSWTRTGAPAIKSEDMRGYGANIPLRLEEKIELLKHASTPQEGLEALAWVTKQRQKASFADTTYGSVAPVEISGFALSQYMAALKYRIGPYLNMMQNIIEL